MNVTLKYESGTEYGTGSGSPRYVASISTSGQMVSINFMFSQPQQGKSDPNVSPASIASLDLALSSQEALQLATAIITQAHHPTLRDKSARWTPPHGMPTLERKHWEGKLTPIFDWWNRSVAFANWTDFHFGEVSLEIRYSITESDGKVLERSVTVSKLINLLPSTRCKIALDEMVVNQQDRRKLDRITEVTIVEVTGVLMD